MIVSFFALPVTFSMSTRVSKPCPPPMNCDVVLLRSTLTPLVASE
jgi:hypothetical protein